MDALISNKYARWAAMVPLALAAALIAQAILKLLYYWQYGDGDVSRFLIEAASGGVTSYVFCQVAWEIAPSAKRYASIALFAVSIAVPAVLIGIGIAIGSKFWVYINSGGMLVGAFIFAYQTMFANHEMD